MKLNKNITIGVPTDFSEVSEKAIDYACSLAGNDSVKIILIHSFQSPPTSANLMINFADILEKDASENMAALVEELKEKYKALNIEWVPFHQYGILTEVINNACEKYGVDLMVMGTTGAERIENKIFGSKTNEVIKKASIPLLAISKSCEFKTWKHLLLALENQDEKENVQRQLEHIFNFPEVEFESVTYTEKEVIPALLKLMEEDRVDGIVLVRKKYGFIQQLFHHSVTQKMAMHLKKPLLIV